MRSASGQRALSIAGSLEQPTAAVEIAGVEHRFGHVAPAGVHVARVAERDEHALGALKRLDAARSRQATVQPDAPVPLPVLREQRRGSAS